jgi:hypothetical protein
MLREPLGGGGSEGMRTVRSPLDPFGGLVDFDAAEEGATVTPFRTRSHSRAMLRALRGDQPPDAELEQSNMRGVGHFQAEYRSFIEMARAALAIGESRSLQLYAYAALFLLYVLLGLASLVSSFVFVGFGSQTRSAVESLDDVAHIVRSFDFVSQMCLLVRAPSSENSSLRE